MGGYQHFKIMNTLVTTFERNWWLYLGGL